MSKSKDKITKLLNKKGYKPTDIEWTHISNEGMDGGWWIGFEPFEGMNPPNGLDSYNIGADNLSDAIEQIEELPNCVLD